MNRCSGPSIAWFKLHFLTTINLNLPVISHHISHRLVFHNWALFFPYYVCTCMHYRNVFVLVLICVCMCMCKALYWNNKNIFHFKYKCVLHLHTHTHIFISTFIFTHIHHLHPLGGFSSLLLCWACVYISFTAFPYESFKSIFSFKVVRKFYKKNKQSDRGWS